MKMLPLNDSDLYFLNEIGAHKIDDFSWNLEPCDEGYYYFEYHRPCSYDTVGEWSISLQSHYNTARTSDTCLGGKLQKTFENIKKIAFLFMDTEDLHNHRKE